MSIEIDPQDDWELEVADKDFKVNREMQTIKKQIEKCKQ